MFSTDSSNHFSLKMGDVTMWTLWNVEMELRSLLDAGRAYVGTVGTH